MEVKTQATLPFSKFADQLLKKDPQANIDQALVDLYNDKIHDETGTLTRERVVKTVQQAVA